MSNSIFQDIVEEALPAFALQLALEKLYAEGYEIRLDARGYLDNTLRKTLSKQPHMAQSLAISINDFAMKMLRLVGFDDARVVLLSVAFFNLKLVEEGLFSDAENQAILTSLMIVADAREDDNPEYADFVPLAVKKAGKLLDLCIVEGMYNKTVVQT